MKDMKDIMAQDQFGNLYHNLGKHPRKKLLEQFGRKHAYKMYIGNGEHIGYIIAGHWLTLYKVAPWKGKNLT